jgi:hypothetical protein
MKFLYLPLVLMVFATISCSQRTEKATVVGEVDSLILPSPTMGMTLYYHEDSIKATEKVQKAFGLSESLSAQKGNVKATYHIICNEKHWLSFLTIVYSSDDFETLDKLIGNIEAAFKTSKNYKWDVDRAQYTNGRCYVYLQPPKRDEQSGEIFAACCIMPIPLVGK